MVISDETKQAVVEFYKTNSTTITCEQFHITWDKLKKILAEYDISPHDAKTNRELTSLYRFGVTNAGKSVELQEKAKQTTASRYGSSNYRNHDKARQTRINKDGSLEASYRKAQKRQEETNLAKYGVKSYFQTELFQEQSRDTCLERYGKEFYRQTQDYRDSVKETSLQKYGVEHYTQSDQYKTKVRDTCKERYGNDSWFGSEAGKNAIKDSCLQRYGVSNAMQSYEVITRAKEKLVQKYGVDNVMKSSNIRSKQAQSSHCSNFEQEVQHWLSTRNVAFSTHYVIKKGDLIHEFDVALYEGSQLVCLADCDGTYYHGYNDDINGRSVNPYIDEYRMLLVPKDVSFLVLLPDDWQEQLEEYFNNKQSYEQVIFNWCKSIDFPYPNIDNVEASYKSLVKADVDKFSMNARYGMRVIDAFHKSIWKAHRKGFLSPYAAWRDEELLRKCINNRIVYKGNNLDPSKVLYGFSAAKIAPKVSVFNPYLAKYLISKYLNEFTTIFDPCSGYSGRLLGATSLGKRYVGQDINATTVDESLQIRDKLNLNTELSVVDSLSTTGSYEALFTCPPYSDKENWNQEILNLTCDEWITRFIENYKCKRYVFVVDNTVKYKQFIAEELVNKSHLSTSKEYVVVIEP